MKRTRVATGHDIAANLVAEHERHDAAIDDIRFSAHERQAVVQGRIATLEAEAQVLDQVIG